MRKTAGYLKSIIDYTELWLLESTWADIEPIMAAVDAEAKHRGRPSIGVRPLRKDWWEKVSAEEEQAIEDKLWAESQAAYAKGER